MKLIIGLGNPGSKYRNNRHNVGHLVIDKLTNKSWSKSKAGLLLYLWLNKDLELIKTQTFVNDSGSAVKYAFLKRKPKLENLYIIHDDLDIPLGSFKIQLGKGPKDHNGLNDIYDKLGTNKFWHVRVGIDNRTGDNRLMVSGKDYVLEDFTKEEKTILDGVIKQICNQLVS